VFDERACHPTPTTETLKVTLGTEIAYPGYEITVLVAAENTPSETRKFVFEWRNFDNLVLQPVLH
jgi:hypothetical protein